MEKKFKFTEDTLTDGREKVMNKHTPGPWWVANNRSSVLAGNRNNPEIVADTSPNDIMAIAMRRDSWTEQSSNARLIAAAPDLLEVLQQVVKTYDKLAEDYVEMMFSKRFAACIKVARKIIAKTEGGE